MAKKKPTKPSRPTARSPGEAVRDHDGRQIARGVTRHDEAAEAVVEEDQDQRRPQFGVRSPCPAAEVSVEGPLQQ
jgi:hypothetical protein